MPGTLQLYIDTFQVSPFALCCYVALREKSLPFETVSIALHLREQREVSFRDASLTAKIPALVHNGFWLSESMAIAEYLEERFPPPTFPATFPQTVLERARARQIMNWLRTDLLALRQERPTSSLFYDRPISPLSPEARLAAEKLIRVASSLLHDRTDSLFQSWCLADTDLAVMLQRLVHHGDPVPDNLTHYANAQWNRPSVAEFVSKPRPPFVPYT